MTKQTTDFEAAKLFMEATRTTDTTRLEWIAKRLRQLGAYEDAQAVSDKVAQIKKGTWTE